MKTKEKKTLTSRTEEFTCDICGERFNTLSKLSEHKHRHGRPELGLKDEQKQMRGDIGAAGMPASPVQ